MGVQHDQVEPFNKAKASMLSPYKCESDVITYKQLAKHVINYEKKL